VNNIEMEDLQNNELVEFSIEIYFLVQFSQRIKVSMGTRNYVSGEIQKVNTLTFYCTVMS